MAHVSSSFRRRWLVPITVLTALAQVLFWGLYAFDHLTHDTVGGPTFLRYLDFDPNNISDAISALAGMNAAVFGIVITVVSIIVQLSADRYTGVARMFFGDRVNLGVAGYYVVSCVVGVWLSVTLKHDYVPYWTLFAMICATTGSLVLMGPYFGYVFRFLEPMNIIGRIRAEAVSTAH